jgi:hypothetical protein
VSAADTRSSGHQPSGHRPSGHRPRFRKQQRTATASAVSSAAATQTPAAVSGCPAGWTAADAAAIRHHGSAAQVALARLRWSRRPGRRGRRRPAVRTRGHRTRPTGHRQPARPRHGGHPRPRQGMWTLRQWPTWTAGSSTVHTAAMSDRNATTMCGTGQHARLTARPVDCHQRRTGRLQTDLPCSRWVGRRSRRIVGMINRTITHLDTSTAEMLRRVRGDSTLKLPITRRQETGKSESAG